MAKLNAETTTKLKRLLSSWVVFYQKTHTFHWDVVGENFLGFHKHLKKLYEDSVEHCDEIAERIRQIGERTEITLNGASADSVVQDNNSQTTVNAIAQDLITAIAQLTSLQTEIYNESDEQGDYVTADLMTQLSKWCDFNSWFLTSISGDEGPTES